MAYVQTRQVTVGELISGSFEQLAAIKRELAIYFGAFFAAGLIADLIDPLQGPIGLASIIGYFVGQYWLYRVALRNAGVMIDDRWKVFALFGMAVILFFPIVIGLNLLIVPGLLLAAKWVMAPSFLVAEERDLFQAMGYSWRASENNLVSLTLAFFVLCMIWMFAALILGGLASAFSSVMAGLGVHVLPVMLMGLSVAAYRALAEADKSIVAVFE